MALIHYHGVTRKGTDISGLLVEESEVPEFVQEAYRNKWRELVVTWNGIDVGEVSVSPGTGHRVWWVHKGLPLDNYLTRV